jgi:sensor histidine kinase YesM
MDKKKLNRLIHVSVFSVLGVFAYLLLVSNGNLPVENSKALLFIWGYLYFIIGFNSIGFAVVKMSNWMSNKLYNYRIKRWRVALFYIIISFTLLFINYALLVTAKVIVGLKEPFIFPNDGYRILVIVWLIELIIIGLLLINRSVVHAMKVQKEASNLREENNQARYIALQNQLNPHFLFNSLNTLIAEIEYDPSNAVTFTRNLSDVYRYVLQNQSKALISISNEVQFMQAYIFLHQVRLGDYIYVENLITKEHLEATVPPLTLQILIENVIKHNTITSNKQMHITLSITDSWLIVSNTLHPKKNFNSNGTGLQNLSKRCLLLLDKDIEVNKSNDLFTVKVPLRYE